MKTMTTTRTVAYVRVSLDKQAEKGVSLEAQRAKVEAYAALYDLQLVEVIVDAGLSAKTLDRPGRTVPSTCCARGRPKRCSS